ncbi:ABC transporter permease [Novipirellula maiorica]|nr:ABC transporter permease [Rhodopirellula maiorica]
MKQLLWKDVITLRPLAYAVIAGILLFQLFVTAGQFIFNDASFDIDPYLLIWILMPNLMALGTPAMLVGNEEEARTFLWLRTLPVRWQRIVDVKFAVGLAGLLAIWAIASLVMAIAVLLVNDTSSPMSDDVIHPVGVARLLFFSVLLLICGFITAYLVRSPMSGLMLLVPVIVLASWFAVGVIQTILFGHFDVYGSLNNVSQSDIQKAVFFAVAYLVALWCLQRWLGRQRLVSVDRSPLFSSSEIIRPYQPPIEQVFRRPSPVFALLWQQIEQIKWFAGTLTLLGFVVLFMWHTSTQPQDEATQVLAHTALVAISSWLGALAFYGDTVRNRSVYFADHGIRPSLIWGTRIGPPLVCCLVLAGISVWVNDGVTAAMMLASFAFGQLAATVTPRATLGLLTAPLYPAFSCSILVPFFGLYPNYIATVILMVPVLLLATWQLIHRWLEQRRDTTFQWMVLAVVLIAFVTPMVTVAGLRFSSTPSIDPQWRSEMFQRSHAIANMPAKFDRVELNPVVSATIFERFYREPEFLTLNARLLAELEDLQVIGDEVTFGEIHALFRAQDTALRQQGLTEDEMAEMQRNALTVMAAWATVVRENAVQAASSLEQVSLVADFGEEYLLRYIDMIGGTDAQIAEIVSRIPDRDLRRRSREVALVQAWNDYQRRQWKRVSPDAWRYERRFANEVFNSPRTAMSFERERHDRFVDEAVKLTLEQSVHGWPVAGSPEFDRRTEYWNQLTGPRSFNSGYEDSNIANLFENWTLDHENAVTALRERYLQSD